MYIFICVVNYIGISSFMIFIIFIAYIIIEKYFKENLYSLFAERYDTQNKSFYHS